MQQCCVLHVVVVPYMVHDKNTLKTKKMGIYAQRVGDTAASLCFLCSRHCG